MDGRDYPDVVRIAATHDGDLGSTARIASQLLGFLHAKAVIPPEWTDALDLRDLVREEYR